MAYYPRKVGKAAWTEGVTKVAVRCLCCKEDLVIGSEAHYSGRQSEGRSWCCDLCWKEWDGLGPLWKISRFLMVRV